MARISKRDYTTKERRTYRFEADWEDVDQEVAWKASIWRNGHFVCTQEGTIQGASDANTNDMVAGRVRAYARGF